MNARRLVLPLVLFAAASVLVSLNGCSLIGAGIGSAIDHNSKPDSLYVRAWQLDTLKVGTHVSLWMNDGTTLSGVYNGIVRESMEAYRERYAGFLAGLPVPPPFPQPGDSTVLVSTYDTRPVRFRAYDYNSIAVQEQDTSTTFVRAGTLTALGFGGAHITADQLWEWVRLSHVPLLSNISLSIPGSQGLSQWLRTKQVPLSDVYRIQYARSKHTARTMFVLGLCVDVTALIVIAVASSQSEEHHYTPPPPPSGDGEGSCPRLYSYDGRNFVLDAEAFSGAIMRSRQETDCCVLDHLTAVDGTCRLKLANRLPEAQFVDGLAVIAVDHPRGSEVIPSAPGRFHTITDPQTPLSATDYEGRVVTDLVTARDSCCWISNPAGRDPDDPAALRDGLVLRFQRPAGTDRAKLVCTIRNTPWLIEMEHHLLSLSGWTLGLWYAELNTFAGPRKEFDQVLQREAGLRVDLWDGRAWKAMDYLPFVGPAVARSVVIPLDLAATEPGEMRIRLESTPGLWMVDRVQADFTQDLPVSVTPLRMRTAVDLAGHGVQADLTVIDGTYYRLEEGDEAEIAFDAPPERSGWDRSYGMLCTGYYTVDVQPSNQPRWALLRRLGKEPGAFSAYSIDLINRWLERAGPGGPATMLLPSR